MTQRFTYFKKDGSTDVRDQPEGPLPQEGEVWARGSYANSEIPDPLNVRVGQHGIKVWMVINWLQLSNDVPSVLRARFLPEVTDEDIDAARWFYEVNREIIDSKIRKESEAA